MHTDPCTHSMGSLIMTTFALQKRPVLSRFLLLSQAVHPAVCSQRLVTRAWFYMRLNKLFMGVWLSEP